MKKFLILVIAIILAWPLGAYAKDLYISTSPVQGSLCNFVGLPASIPATGLTADPVNGCTVDIQSLLGPGATYTVTAQDCNPVTGAGIPAGTMVCSASSSPFSFTLPAVSAPAAPTGMGFITK